jgi:tyrosyl-tRNA synthetase
MSISDNLMWRYFELLSFKSMSEINQLRTQVEEGLNPRDAKVQLAEELVERFHCKQDAVKANENFVARFSKGAMPDDMPEFTLNVGSEGLSVANLLKDAGLVDSTSDAMRMIKQGAVKIDGERVEDRGLVCEQGTSHIYQVGKRRFARVTLV